MEFLVVTTGVFGCGIVAGFILELVINENSKVFQFFEKLF